jgi:hypothetical protein
MSKNTQQIKALDKLIITKDPKNSKKLIKESTPKQAPLPYTPLYHFSPIFLTELVQLFWQPSLPLHALYHL